MPNRPCIGWLTSPDGSANAASAIAASIKRGFRNQAKLDVGRIEVALLGEILERGSGADAGTRCRGFVGVRKHDLRHFAPFRRAKLVAALFEYLLGVIVGDIGPLADFFRA